MLHTLKNISLASHCQNEKTFHRLHTLQIIRQLHTLHSNSSDMLFINSMHEGHMWNCVYYNTCNSMTAHDYTAHDCTIAHESTTAHECTPLDATARDNTRLHDRTRLQTTTVYNCMNAYKWYAVSHLYRTCYRAIQPILHDLRKYDFFTLLRCPLPFFIAISIGSRKYLTGI